jgi:phosphatidylglycerophosphate synthase
MVSQVVAIFLLLLGEPFPVFERPAIVVLWGVVGLTVVSGAAYFWRFWRDVVRSSPSRPQPESQVGPEEAEAK